MTVIVNDCVIGPGGGEIPVTVTVNVPDVVVVIVRVDIATPTQLHETPAGARVAVTDGLEVVADSATSSAKPLTPATVTMTL